jgi:hypothetical protein
MHSPYGKDVVAQFVDSCNKYGIKPCYYFGPNANGYFVTHNYTAEQFVEAQLGQLTELLTNYGTNYVSRLWWDHYQTGGFKCWEPGTPKQGPNPVLCPPGAFPKATSRFVELVRKLSPSTILCPGPDCDTHYRHSGLPSYPVWYPCTGPSCSKHEESNNVTGFHPETYNDDMHTGGWFCNGPCDDASKFWNASHMWQIYMATAGAGRIVTLNAPPGSTGQIPQPLADTMARFGTSLKEFQKPVTASARIVDMASSDCNNTVLAELNFVPSLNLSPTPAVEVNAFISREDLSEGQRITSYAIDYFVSGGWKTFERGNFSSGGVAIGIHGESVGFKVIDFVTPTEVEKVRFRCLTAMAPGSVKLTSFSAHKGPGPEGPMDE